MYYEIYLDSMFILHFCLNFFLLLSVNQMMFEIASIRRLLMGAAIGAALEVFFFLFGIHMRMLQNIGFCISILIMVFTTFGVRDWKQFIVLLEKMTICTLLTGGILLALLKWVPTDADGALGTGRVLFAGSVSGLTVWLILRRKKRKKAECKVILYEGTLRNEIGALIDTGNTLNEPISGRPVMVVEEKTLIKMFKGCLPEFYRVIPYRSVGKEHGILKGYLLDSMVVEIQGICKEYKNVYVADSKEAFAEGKGYCVILNPRLLEE